jgi:threonine dehydratase
MTTTPHPTGQAPSAQHHELTAADVGTVVTRHGIHTVEPLIRPYLRHTPAITVDRADFGLPPGPLVLKLEQLQHGGSFKARGAFANLLLRDLPAAGVVAASGGNHGAAVAFAARALGIPARIYVPHVSSPAKIDRIRSYGADLVVAGDTYSDARWWASNRKARRPSPPRCGRAGRWTRRPAAWRWIRWHRARSAS